jgi:hypothetical protein
VTQWIYFRLGRSVARFGLRSETLHSSIATIVNLEMGRVGENDFDVLKSRISFNCTVPRQF